MEKSPIRDKSGRYLNSGDLIEFKRFLYSHWGVYVGDGNVIHYSQVGKVSSSDFLLRRRINAVEKIKLKEIEGEPYQNNVMDGDYEPRKPDEIVNIAETMLFRVPLQKQDYFLNHVHTCKDFALYCRYDNLPKSSEIITYAVAGIMGLIIYYIFHNL